MIADKATILTICGGGRRIICPVRVSSCTTETFGGRFSEMLDSKAVVENIRRSGVPRIECMGYVSKRIFRNGKRLNIVVGKNRAVDSLCTGGSLAGSSVGLFGNALCSTGNRRVSSFNGKVNCCKRFPIFGWVGWHLGFML